MPSYFRFQTSTAPRYSHHDGSHRRQAARRQGCAHTAVPPAAVACFSRSPMSGGSPKKGTSPQTGMCTTLSSSPYSIPGTSRTRSVLASAQAWR